MKLNLALVFSVVFAAYFYTAAAQGTTLTVSSQASFIKIRITITRITNGVQTQRVFEINLKQFMDLLKRFGEFKDQLPPEEANTIQSIIDALLLELTKFSNQASNRTLATEIAGETAKLFGELYDSNSELVQTFLDLFSNYITEVTAAPTTTTKKVPPAPVTTTAKPETTTKAAMPTAAPVITININVTDTSGGTPVVEVKYPASSVFIVTLLNLLKDTTKNTTVKNLITELLALLADLFNKPTYVNLMKFLLKGIALQRAAPTDSAVQGLFDAIVTYVISTMNSNTITGLNFPSVSVLVSFLMQLNANKLITNAQLDANLALLNNGKQNDPLNLLRVLVAILQALLSSIPSELRPKVQGFITAVNNYVANPSGGSKGVIDAVTTLVDAVISYTGADKNDMISLVVAILKVLLDALPGDKTALNALLVKLLAGLPPLTTTTAAPNAGGNTGSGGCTGGTLGMLLCNVGNLVSGLLGGTTRSNGPGGLGGLLDGLLGL